MTDRERLLAYGIDIDASTLLDAVPFRRLPTPPRRMLRGGAPLFGREDEQRRLRRLLRADNGPDAVVLYGEPGSGRTALALEVAVHPGRRVVRIDASSGATDLILMELLAEVGHSWRGLLRIAYSDDPDVLLDLASAFCRSHPCEVVLDDVPDVAVLKFLVGALRSPSVRLVATALPLPGLDAPGSPWHAEAVGPLPGVALAHLAQTVVPRGRLKAFNALPPELRFPALLPLLLRPLHEEPKHRAGHHRDRTVPDSATALLARLSPAALRALTELAPWAGVKLAKNTARELGVPENAWAELQARGLFPALGALSHNTLHPALCAALGLTATPAERTALDRRAAKVVRDQLTGVERSPDSLLLGQEALLALARRLAKSAPDAARELFPPLARHWRQDRALGHLAVLAHIDHLHLAHVCRRELGLAQRDVGLLSTAERTLRALPPGADHREAVLASVLHHQGRHAEARTLLGSTGVSDDPDDPEALLTLAAIETDQGGPGDAGALLRRADSATPHHAQQLRLRILLEHARDLLRRGRPGAALSLLSRITTDFQGHALTEHGRALVLLGRRAGDCTTLEAALDYHRKSEDLRGTAWTHYYLGLARALADHHNKAAHSFLIALAYFVRLPDRQGIGWSLYRLDQLDQLGRTELFRVDRAVLAKRRAEMLNKHDAPHAAAWIRLEEARHALRTGADPAPALDQATETFLGLGDERGYDWALLLRHVRNGDGTGATRVLRRLAVASEPHDTGAAIRQWHRFLERQTDAPPPEFPYLEPELSHFKTLTQAPSRTPRCHIRVTLQDDSPTPGAASQLLVRVQPDPAHPWHDRAAAPWLTVVATALTRARTEPPSATLRPSERVADGARFDFTPHTAGVHHVRFTVLDPVTDTVLQRVRVELDVPPQRGPRPLSAPPRLAVPTRFGARPRTSLARPPTHRPAVQNPLTPRPSEKA